MPNKTQSLAEKARTVRARAEEILSLKQAVGKLEVIDRLKRDLIAINSGLKNQERLLAKDKYELSKLDRNHPEFERMKVDKTELVKMEEDSVARYKADVEKKHGELERTRAKVEEEIRVLEENGPALGYDDFERGKLIEELVRGKIS